MLRKIIIFVITLLLIVVTFTVTYFTTSMNVFLPLYSLIVILCMVLYIIGRIC